MESVAAHLAPCLQLGYELVADACFPAGRATGHPNQERCTHYGRHPAGTSPQGRGVCQLSKRYNQLLRPSFVMPG